MLEFKRGDILMDDAEALVNTVNCVGVMGRGIALQFKREFPENFRAYAAACKRDEVQPGRMFVHETGRLMNPLYIINFPTKRHWRAKSRLADIEAGLEALVNEIETLAIRSIAIPPLGSGLGGLNWDDVRSRIVEALADFDDLAINVYEPSGAPAAEEMVKTRESPNMTPGRAALVGLLHRYHMGLLESSVSLLEAHKLMYFLQESGEPLRLRFNAGPYGPFAENLGHVLERIEGHFVSGYADGGDSPTKPLEVLPGSVEKATSYLDGHLDTLERFSRVAELVRGFESSHGLELLSTVHWVLTNDSPESEDELVERVHDWDPRKRQFTPRQIHIAADALERQGWVSSRVSTEA